MTHPNFIKIDTCDVDGGHKFDEVRCNNCGTVFCLNCRANNIGAHDVDYMICPGCGQNAETYDDNDIIPPIVEDDDDDIIEEPVIDDDDEVDDEFPDEFSDDEDD